MAVQKKKSSLKAAFWYTVSNLISKTILYLCTPLFTRILTKTELGQYYNFISLQNILLTIFALDLGASITVAYFDYEDKEFQSFISTISLTSVVVPLVLSSFVIFFKDFFTQLFNMEWHHLLILLSNLTLGNTLQLFQVEQYARVEYRLSSFLTFFSAAGTVLLTFALLFINMTDKLTAVLIGNVAFNIVVSMLLLLFLLKRKLSFRWNHLKFALILSIPLIPHTLSSAITGSSGQVLITKFCGAEKTALFGLAFTISLIVTMFVSSVNKAWVPWFYDKLKRSEIDKIKNAVKTMLPAFSAGTIGLCLIAPEIILIVGGGKYEDAIYLMPPIILHCFFNFVYTLYVNIEFYEKKTYLISLATICTAVVNFSLNYVLLQKFDYYIAAYVTFFTALLLLLFHFLIVSWMNKIYIFDNGFILQMLLITSFVSFLIILTYQYNTIRLFSVLFYGIAIVFSLIKNKVMVSNLLRELLG